MIVKGSDLMIFFKEGAKFEAVAYATNHTLDIQADIQETSSKDSGKWKDNQVGKLGWTASSENLCAGVGKSDTYQKLHAKMIAREPIDIHCTLAANADNDSGVPAGGWKPKGGEGMKGKAYISGLSLNAPDGQNATMTINLTGSGALLPDDTASPNA